MNVPTYQQSLNVLRPCFTPPKKMVLTSLDSYKNFQIVECYYGFYGGTSKGARQAILLERYKFDCHCEACTLDWPTLQNMASRADSMKKAAQILTTVDILKSSIANKHV